MHWTEQLYKKLDEKYSEELSKYNITSEEIVRDMWVQIRKMLADDTMHDVLIHYLGTFSVRIPRLFHAMFYQKVVIDVEMEKPEEERNIGLIFNRRKLLKKCLAIYNKKVAAKHQLRRRRNVAQIITYNEEENKFYGEDNKLVENYRTDYWYKSCRKKQGLNTDV